MSFRIGDLSYISGLPISEPLRAGWVEAPGLEWTSGLPAELDALMAAGELDAGPISSLEYLRDPDRYTRLPDLALSSWGRIGSATLFSRVPFSKLDGQRVAVPRAGATSNVLSQWLLRKSFGVEGVFVETDGDFAELIAEYPAVLLIGDAAIVETRRDETLRQLDLGEAWWHAMKTPMVHTVWVCQASLPREAQTELARLFSAAKQAGKEHLPEVVQRASERLAVPPAEIEAYYALLNYDLAPVHVQSMAMFADFADELALLP